MKFDTTAYNEKVSFNIRNNNLKRCSLKVIVSENVR